MITSNEQTFSNLDELFRAIRKGQIDDLAFDEWTSFPTFGGDRPEWNGALWSWDEDRMLVGESVENMIIMPRPERTQAGRWIAEQPRTAAEVLEALADGGSPTPAARDLGVEVDQRWADEATVLTFPDTSTIEVSGDRVLVRPEG